MPAILCFGDSNTWGYDPAATVHSPVSVRHPVGVRWTGVMAELLGPGYEVIGAGQNGRTTVFEDPHHPGRSGRSALPVFLDTFKPLDLVVIMLGTNDLKTIFHAPPGEIAAGAAALAKIVRQSEAGPDGAAPRVLLVCPPVAGPFDDLPDMAEKFDHAEAKSRRLPDFFRLAAAQSGSGFLDAQPLMTPSPLDGLHFDVAAHRALGEAVAATVKEILPPG